VATASAGDPVRIVDRYAVYDRLAEGGMGSVHLGRLIAPTGFSRTVAIKRLHAHHSSDASHVARFLEEARIASRIRHPNVAATIDVVSDGEDVFLVMEYVAGASLAHLLAQASSSGERVPLSIAATVIAGVLHGLHAAHEATSERGAALAIVHRDVSPQNIVVGADGIPRVVDFGVAKASDRRMRTEPGRAVGKREYMAPEQLEARREVTRAVDVYAAGIVLWEVIAGRPMFGKDAPYAQVLAGATDPPSRHRWARDATVPTGEHEPLARLDAIVMRAIDLDPARRYATARDMAVALEDGVPVASQSAIAAWVAGLAGEVLRARAAKVADIERRSVGVVHGAAPARRGIVRVGETAPEIDALTTSGDRFVLSSSSAPFTVIYFFPMAFTPGCTREARMFRDSHAELALAGADVVGISTDDQRTQCAFAEAERVNFPMIADADTTVSRAYGVLWPLVSRTKRVTFVVDRDRKVLAVFRHELQIAKHRNDVLQFVDKLFRARQVAHRG
jgi:peroxiredoxin